MHRIEWVHPRWAVALGALVALSAANQACTTDVDDGGAAGAAGHASTPPGDCQTPAAEGASCDFDGACWNGVAACGGFFECVDGTWQLTTFFQDERGPADGDRCSQTGLTCYHWGAAPGWGEDTACQAICGDDGRWQVQCYMCGDYHGSGGAEGCYLGDDSG